MKEVNVILFKLTKEEAAKLPVGKPVLIYNTFTKTYRIDRSGPSSLARCKYAAQHVKYFIFDRDGCDE